MFWRLLTILIIAALVCPSVLAVPAPTKYYFPNYHPVRQPAEEIYINEQYGAVVEREISPERERLIVLVEDAHCNYQVQTNIAKILEVLIGDYGIDLVGMEGAVGKHELGWYESLGTARARREVSDIFVRKGLVTGPEYLRINSAEQLPFTIYGVEDGHLYVDNFISFRRSWVHNREAELFITEMKSAVSKMKEKIYSPRLLEFDEKQAAYDKGSLSLMEWIRYISQFNGGKNVNLTVKAIRLEDELDLKRVAQERAALVRQLQRDLPEEDVEGLLEKSFLFKLGKISALEFYGYLPIAEENDYPELVKYIELLKLQAEVDTNELFRELAALAGAVEDKLIQNEDQRRLAELNYKLNIMAKLFNLKLTREELAYYQSRQAEFRAEKLVSPVKNELPRDILILLPQVDKWLLPAAEFYRLALERDRVLLENLLARMDEDKRQMAIMVTGGFHVEGMTKLIREKGINYLVVAPVITEQEKDNPYHKLMLDGRVQALALPGFLVPDEITELLRMTSWQEEVRADFIRLLRGDLRREEFEDKWPAVTAAPGVERAAIERIKELIGRLPQSRLKAEEIDELFYVQRRRPQARVAPAVVRDGWRPLATTVALVGEMIDSGQEYTEEQYRELVSDDKFRTMAERIYEGRPLTPERIETYVHNQADPEQALIELIANAQDASSEEKAIGRFGVGAYQMFQELRGPEDRIIITTSTDGITALQIEYRLVNGQICYQTRTIDRDVSQGTRVEIKAKLSPEAVAANLEYAQRKLRANARGRVMVNGRQVNEATNYHYINGDRLELPEVADVEVMVTEDGYRVVDRGAGMSAKTFFEKFTVPKEGAKRIEGQPVETEREVMEEKRIFYLEPAEASDVCHIALQVSGVIIEEITVSGVNLPAEMIIELPHSAWLPESRDKIALDEMTERGLQAIIDTLIDLSRTDITERYALLNALGILVERLTRDSEDKDLLYSFWRKCQGLIGQEEEEGKMFLPNRQAFAALAVPADKEVIYLEEVLFDFQPGKLSGISQVRDFSSPTHGLYVADLDTEGDNTVYLSGTYTNGKGWIILDRRTWEAHKDEPWLLNVLYNFEERAETLGRLLKPRPKKRERPAEETERPSVDEETGLAEDILTDEEIEAITQEIVADEDIAAQLLELDEDDAEFIQRKIREAVMARQITAENAAEMKERIADWLAAILRLQGLLPASATSGAWLRQELFQHFIIIFQRPAGARGKLRTVKKGGRLYIGYQRQEDVFEWITFSDAGQVVRISSNVQQVLTVGKRMVFIEEDPEKPDRERLFVWQDGQRKYIADNCLQVVGDPIRHYGYFYFTEVDGKVEIYEITATGEEKRAELTRDDYLTIAPSLNDDYSMVKRGGALFLLQKEKAKSFYRISAAGEVTVIDIAAQLEEVSVFYGFFTREIFVDEDNNIVLSGILANRFEIPSSSGETQVRMQSTPGIICFSAEGRLIYRHPTGFMSVRSTIDKENAPRIWAHKGYVYYEQGENLYRIDQEGKTELVYDAVDRISDMSFQGEKFFFKARDLMVDDAAATLFIHSGEGIDKLGKIHGQPRQLGDKLFFIRVRPDMTRELVMVDAAGNKRTVTTGGQMELYSYNDRLYYTSTVPESEETEYVNVEIGRLTESGEKQVIRTVSGYIDETMFGPGAVIFNRAYNEREAEEFFGHTEERLPAEVVEVDLESGEMRFVAGERADERKMTFTEFGVMLVEDSLLAMAPNMPQLVQRTEILQSNLERLGASQVEVDWLFSGLNADERARAFCSLAAYPDWMPAMVFLVDEFSQQGGLAELKEPLDRLIRETKNIKMIRQVFVFINYVLAVVSDRGLAVRIVNRWLDIYFQNRELAEMMAAMLQKEVVVRRFSSGAEAMRLGRPGRIMQQGRLHYERSYPFWILTEGRDRGVLPADTRLYLEYLTTDDLSVLGVRQAETFSREKQGRSITNRGLEALIKLRTLFPGKIGQDELTLDTVAECAEHVDERKLRGLRNKIRGAVNGQDKTQQYWIRELVQNARDAIWGAVSRGEEIAEEDRQVAVDSYITDEPNKRGFYEWIASVRDPVGMSLSEVMNLLLPPDVSGKEGQGYSGFLGHGFFTVFTKCDEVRMRTGKDGVVTELILKPVYDAQGLLLNIEVLEMNSYRSDFRGTEIQRVNFFRNPGESAAIMGHLYVTSQARKMVAGIPSEGEKGVTVLLSGEKINEDTETVAEVSYSQLEGPIQSRFSPAKVCRVNLDDLYLCELAPGYTAMVPVRVLNILRELGWNVEFPQGTPVLRTRNGLKNAKQYQPWVAALGLQTLARLYLEEEAVEIPGLPHDYAYSNRNALTVELEVQTDADFINSGRPQSVDWAKYERYPNLLVQLVTVVEVNYAGEVVSLDQIKRKVLAEYRKESADEVDLSRVLPSGMQAQRRRAEEYIRKEMNQQRVDVSDLAEEKILIVFREFFKRLSKLIGTEENECLFECAFGANHSASAMGKRIYWNLANSAENITALRDFLMTGKVTPAFEEMIRTFIHESAHTIEHLYREQYRNFWTHQREVDLPGSHAWIMEKLFVKVIKQLTSTEDFRSRFEAEMLVEKFITLPDVWGSHQVLVRTLSARARKAAMAALERVAPAAPIEVEEALSPTADSI